MDDNLTNILNSNASAAASPQSKLSIQNPKFTLIARKSGDLKTSMRPQRFEELAPTCNIQELKNLVDNPSGQVLLFEGVSGVGKTTCARIVAKANVCLDSNKDNKPCLLCKNCINFENNFDVLELNVADKRKIDDMRELVQSMAYRPQFLNKKIYILDEVQQLTNDSQQLLLKYLEEPRPNVLIFLCTTDKSGILQTLIDRTRTITFNVLKVEDAAIIANQLLQKVNKQINLNLIEELYNQSHGSVRAFLNNIDSYIAGSFDSERFDNEESSGVKELASELLKGNWKTISKILKQPNVRAEAEKTGIGLESYFRAAMLNGAVEKFGPLLELMIITTGFDPYNKLVLKCYKIWKCVTEQYNKTGK